MKRQCLFLGLLVSTFILNAQNPFEDYGFEVEYVTMTQGEFNESHDEMAIVEIGDVLFDTKNNKILMGSDDNLLVDHINPEVTSRFISIDPEAERYYSISPYAYCANNPIRYIDPDGRKIQVYSKNQEYRQQVLGHVQTLTDSKLGMAKDGTIYVVSGGSGSKTFGTALVGGLIGSENSHVIVDNSSGDIYTAAFSGTSSKTSNGEGTGSVIMFDINKDVNVIDTDGQTRTMGKNIVIGHELIHSSHMDNGTVKLGDADDYLPEGPGHNISNEEKATRQQENILRQEQGVSPLRQVSVPLFGL